MPNKRNKITKYQNKQPKFVIGFRLCVSVNAKKSQILFELPPMLWKKENVEEELWQLLV